jgi:hypothetical protein
VKKPNPVGFATPFMVRATISHYLIIRIGVYDDEEQSFGRVLGGAFGDNNLHCSRRGERRLYRRRRSGGPGAAVERRLYD